MIFNADVESELLRVWNLINELSEQLQENRGVTANLRDQAERLKVRFYFPCHFHLLYSCFPGKSDSFRDGLSFKAL
jgi:hypothetical protein